MRAYLALSIEEVREFDACVARTGLFDRVQDLLSVPLLGSCSA